MGNQNVFDIPMKRLNSTQLAVTNIQMFLLFIAFI